jgi:flavin-dependent dehydrogenase
MQSCDVLIVGGGPAGSSCARRLREAGLDVLVRDRAFFPRDKPCAGWLTPGVLETLALDLKEYADGRTLQTFTGFWTGRIGGPGVLTQYDRPVSFGIRRCEFDRYLLERSGARFLGGAPVRRLVRAGTEWVVDDAIRTPLVVGAGGHFCPVARVLNGAPPPGAAVVAQEVEFLLDERQGPGCRVLTELPELYFCADLKGYGWCVRKGDYLNVGLGRRDASGLSAHVRGFVAFLQERGRIPGSLASPWKGHAYLLLEGPARRVVDHGVLLIGDSAGLAVPASGEGIRAAVESGLLAADAILASRGRYQREDLEPYASAIERRLGRRRARFELPSGVAELLGPLLLSLGWFARHMILDRWFLQTHRRPLELRASAA